MAKNHLGNIKDQSLEEILNGPKAQEIRASMIKNERVNGCDACWRQDAEHRMQTFFNNKYFLQQPIGSVTTKDPNLTAELFQSSQSMYLKYLDLRWNNTCNFACIYCGDWYSSLWAEENQKHRPIESSINKIMREHKEVSLEYIKDGLTDIDWIYFAGGEPLAIKENAQLLDDLYAANPDCVLQINTNLSLLNGNPIFERLKKFHNVRWMVSGETMGEIFNYVRWPGDWAQFKQNLSIIAHLRSIGHEITFNPVAMNINHLSLWQYVDFILDLDLVSKPSDINLNIYNMRESSQPFALQRMPLAWKDQVRDLLSRRRYEIRGVNNYIDALNDSMPTLRANWDGLEYTIARLTMLDKQRGLDSRNIFPHVYDHIASQKT